MSLYNMLFGVNAHAPMLLSFLGITANDVPRFRDCYVEDGKIAVHTRTGGGNRDDYAGENDWLTTLPGYVRDEDDDFDCTYATFYFEPPEEVARLVAQLSEIGSENPGERWQKLFADMKANKDSPQVARALEVGKPIIEAITSALASVDRSPEGGDPEEGRHAKHESAVAATSGETPNGGRNDPRD